ncbi:MAG: hypothetical protein U0941_03070 [Planctomycetaceae bacterium]
MRSPLKKQLFKTLQREMKQRYPGLALTEHDSDRVWSKCLMPELYIFFKVAAFEDTDTFVAEVAWSDKGLFPWEFRNSELDFDLPVWRIRMGRLWKEWKEEEPVWELVPEDRIAMEARSKARMSNKPVLYPPSPSVETVLPRIEPAVINVFEKFQEYGVPLFNKLGNHRGLGDVL